MAINATCVWEVRDDGADTNGGGYDSAVSGAGTDYSQQAAAQLALTDVVANGTTTLTSATGGFTSAMIGNAIYLQGGTGALAATWRMVTGRTDTNTITVDATVAAGTGITGNLGGALGTVAQAVNPGHSPACPSVAGNTVYVNYRTGTAHTIGESLAMTRGGDTTTGREFSLIGYDGTAGTRNRYSRPTNRPTLKRTVAAGMITSIAHGTYVRGFIFDLDSGDYSVSSANTNSGLMEYCKAINSGTSATIFASGFNTGFAFTEVEATVASGSTSWAFFQAFCTGCKVNLAGTTGTGFASCWATNCIVSGGGTGSTSVGFSQTTLGACWRCVAYNVATGFVGANTFRPSQSVSCIASTCATGFSGNNTAGSYSHWCRGCATYNCTASSANLNQSVQYTGAGVGNTVITVLSADPFTNAASGDFSLNNTAGGGAAARATGWYPVAGLSTVGYPDMGAFQHQGSASGGGARFF